MTAFLFPRQGKEELSYADIFIGNHIKCMESHMKYFLYH